MYGVHTLPAALVHTPFHTQILTRAVHTPTQDKNTHLHTDTQYTHTRSAPMYLPWEPVGRVEVSIGMGEIRCKAQFWGWPAK